VSSLRLFISLDTPEPVKRSMAILRDDLARRMREVRWEDARKFHCTLRFLGSVEHARLGPIEEQVRAAASGTPPLSLRYSGIGFFPDSGHPRILWVGITDIDGTLGRLQQRISAGLSSLGFIPEERPFHPHVTLGRIGTRRRPDRLTDIMKTCTFEHPPVIVPAVEIMQSVLSPHGSEYLLLRSIPLVSAGGRGV